MLPLVLSLAVTSVPIVELVPDCGLKGNELRIELSAAVDFDVQIRWTEARTVPRFTTSDVVRTLAVTKRSRVVLVDLDQAVFEETLADWTHRYLLITHKNGSVGLLILSRTKGGQCLTLR